MREIKVKLYYQHGETGRIVVKIVKFGEPIPWLGKEYGGHIGEGEYTGLKDSKEKEIYEGDILKYWGGIDSVKFVNGAFIILHSCCDYFDIIEDQVEIIGNIYENPELIK